MLIIYSVREPNELSMNLCLQPCPPVHFVYHQNYVSMVHTYGPGFVPKAPAPITVVVLSEFIDPQTNVLDDLYGKVEILEGGRRQRRRRKGVFQLFKECWEASSQQKCTLFFNKHMNPLVIST
jgi:hypothetical protein